MLSISEKLIILLITLSSQIFPGNNIIFIPYISIFSLIIILIYYVGFNKYQLPIYSLILVFFLIISLVFQYDDLNSFIKQFSRLIYPWLLLFLFNLLILKNVNKEKKILSILNFTSLSIYIILLPDFISLIYTLINNPNNLILLKLSSIIYRETNTTAFLLLYAIIFRIENKLSNYKELFITSFFLLLSFSRSAILMFFVYLIYKCFNKSFHRFNLINFKLVFSRLFPFAVLGAMLIIWITTSVTLENLGGYSISLDDRSFFTRILLFSYIKYYLSTINLSEMINFLFGYGWSAYNDILKNLPFNYEGGTTGHTIIGVLPEYGFIYTCFLFLFFYIRAYRGFIADSILLGLSILAFFPFPYTAPIICLIQTHRKLNIALKENL